MTAADPFDLCSAYLDLIDAQSVHPGHKAGQSGLPCATHTNQQEMSLWLTEDSRGTFPQAPSDITATQQTGREGLMLTGRF